jgi:methylmalonyl-CoA mutase N-terminal domain/subunit
MSKTASRSSPLPDAAAGGGAATSSGVPLQPIYRPADLEGRGWSYELQLADPGQFPFTRGPHATMYRNKP